MKITDNKPYTGGFNFSLQGQAVNEIRMFRETDKLMKEFEEKMRIESLNQMDKIMSPYPIDSQGYKDYYVPQRTIPRIEPIGSMPEQGQRPISISDFIEGYERTKQNANSSNLEKRVEELEMKIDILNKEIRELKAEKQERERVDTLEEVVPKKRKLII